MNDHKFTESVINKPLFEETRLTSAVSALGPTTGRPKVELVYNVLYMRVYRQVRELTRKKVQYFRWDPQRIGKKHRIWCLLDLCNGCAGEATGPLWMFSFQTRADARAYRKYLETLRASGHNVVKVSHVFCMWA